MSSSPDNYDRADLGRIAIDAFTHAAATDAPDALTDLLADLMHWADATGQDFDDALGSAVMHYTAEIDEDGRCKPTRRRKKTP